MTARTVLLALSAAFLIALVQLLSALVSPWAALGAALLLGLLAASLFGLFGAEFESPWSGVLIAAAASAAGSGVGALAASGDAWRLLAFAPLLALAAASLRVLLGGMAHRRRCELCERRLSGPELACPRCGLVVGEQCCWVHEHLRCNLCEQNEVPLFSNDPRWWDRQFGPRVRRGRCQVTLEDAAAADLRACPRCGRLQSVKTWDLENGQCVRCSWTVEDLPERLAGYLR